MSMPPRRAKRRDDNEPDIVRALERVGAQVWRLDQPADLLVGYHQVLTLLEVKAPDARARLTMYEAITAAECAWMSLPYHVVTSPVEALEAIGAVN